MWIVIQERGHSWPTSVPSVLNYSPQLRVSNNMWHYVLEWNRIYVIFVQNLLLRRVHFSLTCEFTQENSLLNCLQCTISFGDKYSLEVHMRKHTGETKPRKSWYCTKSFLSVVSLQLHEKKHTGENSFNCSQCEKAFRFQGRFKTHLRVP